MNADLPASNETEAVLETDLRSGVEAEQVSRQIAKITLAEWPAETMRDPEGTLESRQAQRGREVDDREVRLREPDVAIGIVLGLRRGGGGGAVALRRCRLWPENSEHGARSDDS